MGGAGGSRPFSKAADLEKNGMNAHDVGCVTLLEKKGYTSLLGKTLKHLESFLWRSGNYILRRKNLHEKNTMYMDIYPMGRRQRRAAAASALHIILKEGRDHATRDNADAVETQGSPAVLGRSTSRRELQGER